MRDPRNWVRPAIALVGGSLAGAGLLILGVRRRRHSGEPLQGAGSSSADEAAAAAGTIAEPL
jgi:hypothetical protein